MPRLHLTKPGIARLRYQQGATIRGDIVPVRHSFLLPYRLRRQIKEMVPYLMTDRCHKSALMTDDVRIKRHQRHMGIFSVLSHAAYQLGHATMTRPLSRIASPASRQPPGRSPRYRMPSSTPMGIESCLSATTWLTLLLMAMATSTSP